MCSIRHRCARPWSTPRASRPGRSRVNAASPYGGTRTGPFEQGGEATLIQVSLLIVDAMIDRSDGDGADSADPASLAGAVAYLAAQSPRAMTHELQVTPALDNWTPSWGSPRSGAARTREDGEPTRLSRWEGRAIVTRPGGNVRPAGR